MMQNGQKLRERLVPESDLPRCLQAESRWERLSILIVASSKIMFKAFRTSLKCSKLNATKTSVIISTQY